LEFTESTFLLRLANLKHGEARLPPELVFLSIVDPPLDASARKVRGDRLAVGFVDDADVAFASGFAVGQDR